MVKKLLKSVHIYRSYRQNKPGGPFFGPHGTVLLYRRMTRKPWYTRASIGYVKAFVAEAAVCLHRAQPAGARCRVKTLISGSYVFITTLHARNRTGISRYCSISADNECSAYLRRVALNYWLVSRRSWERTRGPMHGSVCGWWPVQLSRAWHPVDCTLIKLRPWWPTRTHHPCTACCCSSTPLWQHWRRQPTVFQGRLEYMGCSQGRGQEFVYEGPKHRFSEESTTTNCIMQYN